ncbi:MAG: hypothetical protein ACYTEK_23620 [Planctomycetota bacterium]
MPYQREDLAGSTARVLAFALYSKPASTGAPAHFFTIQRFFNGQHLFIKLLAQLTTLRLRRCFRRAFSNENPARGLSGG